MSETPRVDAVLTTDDGAQILVHGSTITALAVLARQLERELTQAQARCAELGAIRDDLLLVIERQNAALKEPR